MNPIYIKKISFLKLSEYVTEFVTLVFLFGLLTIFRGKEFRIILSKNLKKFIYQKIHDLNGMDHILLFVKKSKEAL